MIYNCYLFTKWSIIELLETKIKKRVNRFVKQQENSPTFKKLLRLKLLKFKEPKQQRPNLLSSDVEILIKRPNYSAIIQIMIKLM